MPETYRIIDVEDHRHERSPRWHILMERADGRRHAHAFPDTIFEIRSGEYGIPADDIEALIEIVLHEPYIPDPLNPRNHASDPAAALGHTVPARAACDDVKPGTFVPAWLYNATSIAQARAAHLARIDHCKANIRRIITAPGDALDVIRDAHNPKPDAIAAIAAHVEQVRRGVMAPTSSKKHRHPLADFREARR